MVISLPIPLVMNLI